MNDDNYQLLRKSILSREEQFIAFDVGDKCNMAVHNTVQRGVAGPGVGVAYVERELLKFLRDRMKNVALELAEIHIPPMHVRVVLEELFDQYVGETAKLLAKPATWGAIDSSEEKMYRKRWFDEIRSSLWLYFDGEYSAAVAKQLIAGQLKANGSSGLANSEVVSMYAPDKIRIFISHRDSKKVEAKALAGTLEKYGASCFVAHDSIIPVTVWKNEIMKALRSMDAFICFITDDYYDSEWTNQEIGYALAKDVPIYPYSVDGTDPCGFHMDIQAIKTGDWALVKCLKKDFTAHPAIKAALLSRFVEAKNGSFQNAKDCFMEIIGLSFTDNEVQQIVGAFTEPAKHLNQLSVLLCDQLQEQHQRQINLSGETYYYQILDKEILSQHSSLRYRLVVDEVNDKASIDDVFASKGA